VRLTIQRMMLAIAVFAIALAIGLSYHRSRGFSRQAQFWSHARGVALVRARNIASGAARTDSQTPEQKQKAVDQAKQFAAYSSRLQSKYERAVFLPWLAVEPDSAPP
jgi:hypothetical protein